MAKHHQMLLQQGARWLALSLAVVVVGVSLVLGPRERVVATSPGGAEVGNRSGRGESGTAQGAQGFDQHQRQLLAAQIAMVCPSGAREFERVELPAQPPPPPPAAQLVGGRPSLEPLRVAMNGSAAGLGASPGGGTWLVDPDEWYVPEDRAAAEPAASDTQVAPEPAEAPPLTPQPEEPALEGPELDTLPKEPSPSEAVPQQQPAEAPATDSSRVSPFAPPPAPAAPPAVETSPSDTLPPGTEAPTAVPRTPLQGVAPANPPAPGTEAPTAAPRTPLQGVAPTNPPGLFAPPPPGMPNPHGHGGITPRAPGAGAMRPEDDPHHDLLAENLYPSAKTCAKCHQQIYDEWSTSSHAYAYVSPMFHKFEQKITELSQGTVGYFCTRCHSPVATSLNLPRDMPLWEMPAVAREGVTCVACHRVRQPYGKTNGERHLVPGDIHQPVYGTSDGSGLAEVLAQKDKYKVKTSPDDKGPGIPIHTGSYYFDQLGAAEFCQACHQVAVHPGIKLEVVWEQYRQSPAHKKGVTCQDCHMGKVPGVASGYECGPVAEINGVKIGEGKKHSNHVFYGPGYSIAHPGIFPMHLKADRWTMDQWLLFDWRAGWGTDEFEDKVHDGQIAVQFPPVWAEADDRYDAREIIDENLKKLDKKTSLRRQVMENGATVDGPFFAHQPRSRQPLKLSYIVTNTNEGHNLPTASLGAQPQLWANVVLIGPQGERLWETGYTDRYGDLCDHHSRDVRAGLVPPDSQLFNLQTMFLITGATGTDREFFLPVNVSFDQLPFLRPGTLPISVLNHPPFIRMESRSIAPLGKKEVKYTIPPEALPYPGRYRLSFRMRSRAEPIYFLDFCGGTPEMARAMIEGTIDVHPFSVEFDVH